MTIISPHPMNCAVFRLSPVRRNLTAWILFVFVVGLACAQAWHNSASAQARSFVAVRSHLLDASAIAPLPGAFAVADLDADGAADVAQTAQNLGGSAALRLHLSQGPTISLPVQTDQPLIGVDAIDIDHDRDVDLIVTPLLAADVVAVFLNDGRGHFTKRQRISKAEAVSKPRGHDTYRTSYPDDHILSAARTTPHAAVRPAAYVDGQAEHPSTIGLVLSPHTTYGRLAVGLRGPPRRA